VSTLFSRLIAARLRVDGLAQRLEAGGEACRHGARGEG
jgi:hypothetical protein